jgi:hypothetical protein
MQNDALKVIFDLNEEWNKIQGVSGSSMVTGVTVGFRSVDPMPRFPVSVCSVAF